VNLASAFDTGGKCRRQRHHAAEAKKCMLGMAPSRLTAKKTLI
jgi:hypothetical protein